VLCKPSNNTLALGKPTQFLICHVPFSTIFSFGGLSNMVHSHVVKVQASSTPKVSCHAFSWLAVEPVTSTIPKQFSKDSIESHSGDATIS
jgi:hypothetical protein